MLDIRTYTWEDVKNTKIVINSTGTTAKLSEFANSSKTDPIVALESVLKLYGFTDIQINNPTGRNIIFSYDSKYRFLTIQLQNLALTFSTVTGSIYWKPFQGASSADYTRWDAKNNQFSKKFSTNGEKIYLGYVAVCMSKQVAFMKNYSEFFSCGNFMQYNDKEIYIGQPIKTASPISTLFSDWPWTNIYIPGYGIGKKAINGSAFSLASMGTQTDYCYDGELSYYNQDSSIKYFSGKPFKFNLTKNYLNNFLWLYEDFTCASTTSLTHRWNYNFIELSYDNQNKKLYLSGYLNKTDSPTKIKEINFDHERDLCWFYYRLPSTEVESAEIKFDYTIDNPSSQMFPRSIESVMSITKDTFTCKLNDIQYRLVDFNNSNISYLFDNTSNVSKNNGNNQTYENGLPEVKDSLGLTSEYWASIAEMFIESSDDIDISASESPSVFYDKSNVFGIVDYVKFTPPSPTKFCLKFINNKKLKDIQPSFSNLFTHQWDYQTDAYFLRLGIGGTDSAAMETKIKFIYEWNNYYNGILGNASPIKAKCNKSDQSDGYNEEGYWFYNMCIDQQYTPIGTGTWAIVQHKNKFSIGIDGSTTATAAIGFLILYKDSISVTTHNNLGSPR